MAPLIHSSPRDNGQRILRSGTWVAIGACVIGTGGLAVFVGHEYAGKTAGAATTPAASSTGSSAQSPSASYANPYDDGSGYSYNSQSPSSAGASPTVTPSQSQAPQVVTGGS